MEKKVCKSYDELPLMLTVPGVVLVLGVSWAGAYELVCTEGFPVLKVGSRIMIPKDKFLLWIEKQCGGDCNAIASFSLRYALARSSFVTPILRLVHRRVQRDRDHPRGDKTPCWTAEDNRKAVCKGQVILPRDCALNLPSAFAEFSSKYSASDHHQTAG